MILKGKTGAGIKKESIWINRVARYIVIDIHIIHNSSGMLHFFLLDPKGRLRVQFLKGNAKETIILEQKGGSIGTYPGELPLGRWQAYTVGLSDKEEYSIIDYEISIEPDGEINHKNYTMLGEERWVDYEKEDDILTILFEKEKKSNSEIRWYRGDLHTHTTLSDGHMSPKEAVSYCEDNGIDFFFLTEHNIVHTGYESTKVLFIPGIEVTTFKGHLLMYGFDNFPDFFECSDFHSKFIYKLLEEKKKKNFITNIAHPVMKPWDWQFGKTRLDDIDLLELCNCPTWPPAEEANNHAIELLDLLWNDGYRIFGVGGSDNHLKPEEKYEGAERPSLYADPSTYVFCEGLSESELLKELKRGRVYVARDLRLDIRISGRHTLYARG